MDVVGKLSIDLFSDSKKFVSLGRLEQEMIDFIISHKPELKERLSSQTDILFWMDRIKHTERHRDDFFSDNEYEICFESIPDIIHHPDYISVHPKDNSISFIKDFSGHVSVAVRIASDGKMSYRTMYPITDAQLTHYIRKNLAWQYKNIDTP
jgi:hypothetical protein